MTPRDAQQLDRIIGQMTDAEKRELLDRLARSLNGGQHRAPHPPDEMTPEQKKRLTDSFRRIASLPIEGPDDGFSGEDHDQVLYGPDSPKTNLPE